MLGVVVCAFAEAARAYLSTAGIPGLGVTDLCVFSLISRLDGETWISFVGAHAACGATAQAPKPC